MITPTDTCNIIDRSKIRRQRLSTRKQLQEEKIFQPTALYFDGRKDFTLTQLKKGNKLFPANIKEEHITLLDGPNS